MTIEAGYSVPLEQGRRLSLAVAFDLWLASWETALSALATATRSRALSAGELAARTTAIRAERELVMKQFALLLGRTWVADPLAGAASAAGSIVPANENGPLEGR